VTQNNVARHTPFSRRISLHATAISNVGHSSSRLHLLLNHYIYHYVFCIIYNRIKNIVILIIVQ